ncbi:hypothetical protein K505DRAFT_324775 [Melanomma pulvis-pyrius CBS 109.77]|uniref:Uncharacterized protein n=1 Tax=Melanomma pulvis-pyrius CBS 109.77 TaxID=1314802 RepID=A0A6A6XE88_9PLEO|nr:hypothetical protein K505DRAFT_324775 [Melanomma pulvis-pyrius CBS 109.77]
MPLTHSLQNHMARDWVRARHQRYLDARGGKGHEADIVGQEIELDWEKRKAAVDGKCKCNFCSRNLQLVAFRCPSGGAVACLPCKMRFSYYGS